MATGPERMLSGPVVFSEFDMELIHRASGNEERTLALGPYRIEPLIDENEEAAGTVYRVRIEPGMRTATSWHAVAEEYYFVLSGTGTAYLDGRPHALHAGDFLRLPPGTRHAFETAEEPLEMLDIHTPGSRPNRDVFFAEETPPGFGAVPEQPST